ncbi:hypothetical protein BGZ99_001220 [Dissophora globulifera]|uniref:Uncharacterized protein n=1 Tax=Dissophora globulifera TaxID=979702 RepID=A0A9P6V0C4_9FUNG|nr:hypothetical protein BGZ99_001220 [Dissophora globulifera]
MIFRTCRNMRRAWSRARIIESESKERLVANLEALGWEACHRYGEADTCTVRRAEGVGRLVVASSDSDHLFHGATQMLRKVLRSSSISSYNIRVITDKLGIIMDQWVVAGHAGVSTSLFGPAKDELLYRYECLEDHRGTNSDIDAVIVKIEFDDD